MRARRLLAVVLAAATLAGCASAADVAMSERPVKQGDGSKQHGPAKSSPSTTETPSTSPVETTVPAPPSTPTAQTPGARKLPNVVGALPTFLTPSHNIGCAITDSQVRCDIREHRYRDPQPPPDCQGDYGQSIAVTSTGIAAFVCVSDTVVDPRAPVLSYASSTVIGNFGCTSRQTGIRCYYLESKHGFWLSQEQPALF